MRWRINMMKFGWYLQRIPMHRLFVSLYLSIDQTVLVGFRVPLAVSSAIPWPGREWVGHCRLRQGKAAVWPEADLLFPLPRPWSSRGHRRLQRTLRHESYWWHSRNGGRFAWCLHSDRLLAKLPLHETYFLHQRFSSWTFQAFQLRISHMLVLNTPAT